jgi:hypothetical protein
MGEWQITQGFWECWSEQREGKSMQCTQQLKEMCKMVEFELLLYKSRNQEKWTF